MTKELEIIISNKRECKVPEETAKFTRAMCFAAGAIVDIAVVGAAVAIMAYPLYWICSEIVKY